MTPTATSSAVLPAWLVVALLVAGVAAQAVQKSAFVETAQALRDAVHKGVQHVVVRNHCDFTTLGMNGWAYHLKPGPTLETIQGDCGSPPPRVPGGTAPMRRLKTRQCVVSHDADLLGFTAFSPTHHWIANIYFRHVRSQRALRPITLTLHDAAWAFFEDVTVQGDGQGDAGLAVSISAQEQVYFSNSAFYDLECPGCPAVAVVAGLADFESCVFEEIHMGPETDADGFIDNAALYLYAWGTHQTHTENAPTPLLRMLGNTYTNITPYAIMTGEPVLQGDPLAVAYVDSGGMQAAAPNATVGTIGEARGLFLEGQHEWLEEEKKQALAVLRGEELEEPEEDPEEEKRPLISRRTIILSTVLGVVVLITGILLILWLNRSKKKPVQQPADDGPMGKGRTKVVVVDQRSQGGDPFTYLPPPPSQQSIRTGHSHVSHHSHGSGYAAGHGSLVSIASHDSHGSRGSGPQPAKVHPGQP